MGVFKSIMANFVSFLLAIILTAIPYAGIELPVINNTAEDCNMTVELISDTHIEEKELIRQTFLVAGLKNISRACDEVDALVVAGDITNYADEPSIAKYYDILKTHATVPVITAAGNHDIGHVGDRDVTDITREEAKANFIRYNNEFLGIHAENNFYSYDVNGYTFIVIGDEVIDGGHWDAMDMGEEQMAFLDSELAKATADGKPAFVVCHWPVDGINGQHIAYPDSEIDLERNDVKSVMEKYENVVYISGHIHGGIKSELAAQVAGFANVEQHDGVTYVSLPTFGIVNSFGSPWPCAGIQMEVYDDEIVFRPRNFLTNKWFTNAVYTIELVK